ncbi:hypothetical protein CLV71_11492 [Actinophytocola oryzae]|uniref:Uncharacterized protein n=1 Tax=Actinophytocola oryzae TaxID=502181 RepID=A0A4R7V456_9PSEU|nr:hypothetical protein CLV71_11492 [Actinophytocola oryzae]
MFWDLAGPWMGVLLVAMLLATLVWMAGRSLRDRP